MSWMQTISGRAVDLQNPDPESLMIEDIAAHLARIPRFNGATREFYSVGQHSVLVSLYLRNEEEPLPLAGLLHDAHEAYFGDITSPVKELLASQFLHARLWGFDRVIEERFIPGDWRRPTMDDPRIKEADRILLATEKRDLMAREPRPWAKLPEPWPGTKIIPWTEYESYHRFLNRFAELTGGIAIGSPDLRKKLEAATSIVDFQKEVEHAD